MTSRLARRLRGVKRRVTTRRFAIRAAGVVLAATAVAALPLPAAHASDTHTGAPVAVAAPHALPADPGPTPPPVQPGPTATAPAPSPSPSSPAPSAPSSPAPSVPTGAPTPTAPTPTGPLVTAPAGYPQAATNNGLFAGFTAHDSIGVPVMSDTYDTTADTGHMWDVGKKAEAAITSMFFGFDRFLIAFCCWLLSWALKFGLAKSLTGPVSNAASSYQTHVINGLGLTSLALVIAGFMCGVQIMVRSRAKGFGELCLSLLVAAIAAVALASPANFANSMMGDNGLLGNTRDTSLSLADISMGGQGTAGAAPGAVADPMETILVNTFVREPHELIQYGVDFDDPTSPAHKCVGYYNDTIDGQWIVSVAKNKDFDSLDPWSYMGKCDKDAGKFNKDPSVERMFAAALAAFAALIMAVLIILMSGGFLAAQLGLGVLCITAVFAVLAGIVPGGGRAMLWRWCGQTVKALLGIFLSIEFLAMFCLLIQSILKDNSGQGLVIRFAILDFITVAGLIFHRRLINAGKDVSFQFTRRLERMNIGGTKGSFLVRPYSTWETRQRSGSQFPLLAARREARMEIGRITTPLAAAAGAAGGVLIGSRAAAARAERRRGGGNGPGPAGPGGTGPVGGGGGGRGPGGAPTAPPSAAARLGARVRRARAGRVVLNTAPVVGRAGRAAVA